MNQKEIQEKILALIKKDEKKNEGEEKELFRDYTLTVLFLKFVTELSSDLQEGLIQSNAFKDLIVPEAADFQKLYKKRNSLGNMTRLDEALRSLEETNPPLKGIFKMIRFQSLQFGSLKKTDEILGRVLQRFGDPKFSLRPSLLGGIESIGGFYEQLIRNFVTGISSDQNLLNAPPEISNLLINLCSPKGTEKIFDPICGTGNLLTVAGKFIRQTGDENSCELYGNEWNERTWAFAKLNLFLHGEDNEGLNSERLETDITIQTEDGRKQKFDVITTTTLMDHTIIESMLEKLDDENGRMVSLVSQGLLYREGNENRQDKMNYRLVEKEFRERILEKNLLESVIALPEKLFHGNTPPISIMIFSKRKKDEMVLFVDARKQHASEHRKNSILPKHITWIRDAVFKRSSEQPYIQLISIKRIMNEGGQLVAHRYLREMQPPTGDLQQLLKERKSLNEELDKIGNRFENMIQLIEMKNKK